jgi:hypothetical protein
MNNINYIHHDNYCNFGIVKYIKWTKYTSFIHVPLYEPKKKNYNPNQLSLFNFDKGGF